ncbi:uncharacterized protein LOC141664128 [Apium graveolens]|uniref:uncharacterized protein LOC141664128 n=1 Tax=Apium graveolens TaxID=4045 RepID=UPI003D7AFF76
MEGPSQKRGRLRLPITDELIEARQLYKQRCNRLQRGRGNIVAGPPTPPAACPPALLINRPCEGSAAETPRQRGHIDKKKREFAAANAKLDIGDHDQVCAYCGALVWEEEFTGRHVGPGPRAYSICCSKGKVLLPLLRPTPPELAQLFTGTRRREVKFHSNSRMYNNIFALSSFGGNIDESINNGSGPYVFRLNDHVYHSIGYLLPPDGRTPKYAQFYMYDGQEAVEHRLQFPHTGNTLDPDIVDLLLQMLNRDNVLIGIFKQVRERYHISEQILVRLRLLERRTSDGHFVNLPSGNDYEFAGLAVVQNLTNPRDILVEYKTTGLERITEIHPYFMSLQYPLLFPHGEDGYRLGIKHRQVPSSDQDNQKTVSMREFQAFRLQFRIGKGHTLLLDGRLLLQYIVAAWCCIEHSRLKWVEMHQSIICFDLYKNIVDSVSHGDTLAAEVGKRVVLPSSFTGGFRYMQQNF